MRWARHGCDRRRAAVVEWYLVRWRREAKFWYSETTQSAGRLKVTRTLARTKMRREKMVKEMRERFEYLKRRKVIDGLLVTVCGLVSKWNAK